MCKLVNKIIVVVEESKERLTRRGVNKDKIHILGNLIDLNEFFSYEINDEIKEQFKNYLVAGYVGGFQKHRGLDTLIKAMAIVQKTKNTKLLLVGGGGTEKHLKKLAKKLRVNVVFTGWIPFSLVPAYIATCKICVIPHIKSSFTDTTLPHKLFQYMACGKPIVVSNVTPIARIVKKYQCGLVFDGTKESLAKCLTSLLENESLSKKMGENGLSAVTSSLNMEKEGQKLINLYSSIIDRSGKRK